MKKVISLFLAVALLLPLIPAGRAIYTIDLERNTGKASGDCDATASAVFESAVVRNQQSGGKAAPKKLEAVVNLKDNVAANSNVTAVIMQSDVYKRLFPAGPSPKGMAGNQLTTYLKDMSAAEQAYYAAGLSKTAGGAATVTIQFREIANYDNASAASKEMKAATATVDGYFVRYTLIVFGDANREDNHGYYVDTFDVDSEGYVRTPSYMLWYDGNKPQSAKNVVTNNSNTPVIYRADTYEGLAETVTLKGQTPDATSGKTPADTPKLNGYAFLGWDESATAPAPKYSTQVGMTYHKPANDTAKLYQTQRLYAIWEEIEVEFDHARDDGLELAPGQVGVPYTTGKVGSTLLVVGKTADNTPADYRSDPRTTKTYTVSKAERQEADGTFTEITDTVNYPNNLPKGLTIGMDGNNGWKLSGTPEVNSDKPIRLTIKVKDDANQSTDEKPLLVTIPKIEKGAQPDPTADENTGLDSQITEETSGEGEAQVTVQDGQIIGMYSRGPQNEATYLPGEVDGTGTMSSYYVEQGMIYEYRPVRVDGGTTDVTYTDGNRGWREVPLPASSYSAEQLAQIQAAMAKNASTVVRTVVDLGASVNDVKDNVVTVEAVDPTQPDWQGAEGWTTDEPQGWKDSYGEIRFDNGVPVVHGLVENDVYEVRFRANSDYTASSSVRITIGGMTGTGSGGSGEADVSKIRTVTFYDWDGTTKLGVVAVGVEEDPADGVMKGKLSKAAYKEFVEPLLNPDAMTIGDDTYETTPNADNEGYLFNPDRMTKPLLTDKGGYTFCGWTYMTEDEYGHYPSIDEAQAAVIDWNEEAITVNTDVMACYGGNSLCGDENTAAERYYTLEYDVIERAGANYIINVTVKRSFIASKNVFPARMKEPILKITATPKGTSDSLGLSSELKRTDVSTATFAFTKNYSRVVIAAADMFEKAGVVSSAVAYSRNIDLGTEDNNTRQNFVKFGTLDLLNESARNTTSASATTIKGFTAASYFDELGLVSSEAARTKSEKLLKAWRNANQWSTSSGDNGLIPQDKIVSLTWEQANAVINNEKNVYIKNVSFADVDPRAEFIQGKIEWDNVVISNADVETNISGYKLYWSRDGINKRAIVAGAIYGNNSFEITAAVAKQYYDRYLIICAVDGSGNEIAGSAIIPIFDKAED